MDEKREAAILSMFYLDHLIQTADKCGIDRERYVKTSVMALIPTVDMINFETYESKDEEAEKAREERFCYKCKYDFANFKGDPEEKNKHCYLCDWETKDQFVPFKEGE